MGQYFRPVNYTKREYVCPWCLSGFAKLWEWAANPWGAIFTLLLRKSTDGGGGDYEGTSFEYDPHAIVGRWACDHVALVGDYDVSQTWDDLPSWRNISRDLIPVWNAFIEIPEMRLTFNPDCSCNKRT